MVPTHGLPFLLHTGLVLSVVPPELKGPRSHTVVSCVEAGAGHLVSFTDVNTLNAASRLVGKFLLARVEDLPSDYALKDVDALLGREVQDVRWGLLGTIEEVMRGPANDVWSLQGPYGEVLIPAVEPVVVSWQEEGPLVVQVPNGLVPDTSQPSHEVGE